MILIFLLSILSLCYFITLLFLKKSLNRIQSARDSFNANNYQSISVIVCARNEEKKLPGLIDAINNQITENLDVEFLLINDRSTDKTKEIMEQAAVNNPLIKIITVEDRIADFAPKKRAIDIGIKKANGDIILLTDADGRPQNQWVMIMATYFAKGADMVIGYAPYDFSKNDSLHKKTLALEYFSIAAIAAATAGAGFPITCVGTNMAYRKSMYHNIGGFGEFKAFISGDDDLFLTRVRESKKYKIVYADDPKSHVYNNPPDTFNKFFNQRLRYASKGFNYPFKVTISLTAYVFYNLALVTGLFLFNFNTLQYGILLSLILIIKPYFEYTFLHKATKIIGEQRVLKYYPIAALFHIPYVLFFGIFGQFKIFKWAENKAEFAIAKSEDS